MATHSHFRSFNEEKISFISFTIDNRGLGFEHHVQEIMWPASFCGIRYDILLFFQGQRGLLIRSLPCIIFIYWSYRRMKRSLYEIMWPECFVVGFDLWSFL